MGHSKQNVSGHKVPKGAGASAPLVHRPMAQGAPRVPPWHLHFPQEFISFFVFRSSAALCRMPSWGVSGAGRTAQLVGPPRGTQAAVERAQCAKFVYTYPPPLAKSPPLQSPPPPGHRHFHVFLVNMNCAGLCCPSALRMALHCFPITTNQAPVYVL